MAVKQEFASRFAKRKDELEWLFMELYHNREGLEVLEREMADAYNARSAELKALDKARSADPDWYKRGNMFGMTMYTDLFAGNLKELARRGCLGFWPAAASWHFPVCWRSPMRLDGRSRRFLRTAWRSLRSALGPAAPVW